MERERGGERGRERGGDRESEGETGGGERERGEIPIQGNMS